MEPVSTVDYQALEECRPKRRSLRVCDDVFNWAIFALILLGTEAMFCVGCRCLSFPNSAQRSSSITLLETNKEEAMQRGVNPIGVAIALLVFVLCSPPSLNFMAKRLVKTFDQKSLSVEVRIKNVHVSLMRRTVTIRDLHVGNPEGFNSSKHLVHVDEVHIKIALFQLMRSLGSTVELPQVNIDGVDIHCEHRYSGGVPRVCSSNLDFIQKFISSSSRDARKPKYRRKTKFILHKLNISKIFLNVDQMVNTSASNGRGPIASESSLRLDDIHEDDFVKDFYHGDGLTKEQLLRLLLDKLTSQAKSSPSASGHMEGVKQWLMDVEQKAERALQHAKEAVQHSLALVGQPLELWRDNLPNPQDEFQTVRAQRDLALLRQALVRSGLSAAKLCPAGGLDEAHFRTIAETTATIEDPEAIHHAFAAFANGQRHVNYDSFKRWIEG